MKFKSLLLGSAAGLLAVGGVQAADLPVKAKAVEYVKICSLYGAGFYYIPGTDTCIQLGGYVQVTTAFNAAGIISNKSNGQPGAENRLSNNYYTRARQYITIDTRTATEYGVVRTYGGLANTWTSGTTAAASTGNTFGNDTFTGGSLGVYFAFIQFAGFTIGKAISQFDAPWTGYPANSMDGLVGGSGDPTGVNQLSYTADFGQGISGTISLQEQYSAGGAAGFQSGIWNTSVPVAAAGVTSAGVATATATNVAGPLYAQGAYGFNALGGTVAPDVVGMIRVDQAWGLFQASVAAHDNHASYYSLTNESLGHPDDKWGWAGQLSLSIKNIPTGAGDTVNVQGVYSNGAVRYALGTLAPTNYALYGGTGLAGAYQSIGIAGAADSVFGGTSAATGTAQQLTTVYGVRGGYTHNWDPYWNTSIFGGWAAIRYNDTAKGLICTGLGRFANAGIGFSCNPDFNIASVGTRTIWTPVKNLAFSAEVVYTMLDQKHAGALDLPAVSAIAKPAATYELKDQNTLLFNVRAQRNF
jgi:hypothetical protein